LVAYLALFPAVFALTIARVGRRSREIALLLPPAVWVATEVARTHLATGFPWVLLGYSQTSVLPMAQLASVFGVYGVSALVVSGNAALAYIMLAQSRTAMLRAASVSQPWRSWAASV
jgi:apolipoprotein N-acyltransferase